MATTRAHSDYSNENNDDNDNGDNKDFATMTKPKEKRFCPFINHLTGFKMRCCCYYDMSTIIS